MRKVVEIQSCAGRSSWLSWVLAFPRTCKITSCLFLFASVDDCNKIPDLSLVQIIWQTVLHFVAWDFFFFWAEMLNMVGTWNAFIFLRFYWLVNLRLSYYPVCSRWVQSCHQEVWVGKNDGCVFYLSAETHLVHSFLQMHRYTNLGS